MLAEILDQDDDESLLVVRNNSNKGRSPTDDVDAGIAFDDDRIAVASGETLAFGQRLRRNSAELN